MQWNNNGVLGASNNTTWNDGTNTLTVPNIVAQALKQTHPKRQQSSWHVHNSSQQQLHWIFRSPVGCNHKTATQKQSTVGILVASAGSNGCS